MIELAAALAALTLTHLVPSFPSVRPALVRVFGQTVFRILYSIVSLAILAWLILAYRNAADSAWLWTPPDWGRWVAVAAMPVAIWLITTRLMRPPGRTRSGVYRTIAAPGSAGLTLWAALHLLNVGEARTVLLFGVFLAISLFAFAKYSLTAPPKPTASATRSTLDGWPIAISVAIWISLLMLHPVVLGVDPLAGILP